MFKFYRILMVILALILLTACAKTAEPVTSVQPIATDQSETLPTQAQAEPTTSSSSPVQPPAVAPADPETIALQGQTLLEERCTVCHSLQKTTSTSASLEEWQTIVENMIQRGAKLSDEEKTILVQFLAEN